MDPVAAPLGLAARAAVFGDRMNLIHADCLDAMAAMEPESVDAVVTDPPYGLEFMGKDWDRLGAVLLHDPSVVGVYQDGNGGNAFSRSRVRYGTSAKSMQVWHEAWAREAFRVAKPSAYLLAFGGTRTVHRLASAIEDAGWIIRDMLVWGYASGFPKSKASLKPAWEPIVMARKPGPLRMLAIDECRIGTTGGGTECPHWPDPCRGHGGDGRTWDTVHVGRPTAIIDAWESGPSLCASCASAADYQARRGTAETEASTTQKPVELPLSDWETFGAMSAEAGMSASNGTTAGSDGTSSSIGRSGRTPTGRSRMATSSITSTEIRPTTASRTCTSCGAAIIPTIIGATRSDTEMERRVGTTSESIDGAFGRWPSNVVLTDPIFDGGWDGVVGGGWQEGGGNPRWRSTEALDGSYHGNFAGGDTGLVPVDTEGTYSRFFLIPKADRADREPVLGGLPMKRAGTMEDDAYIWPDGRETRRQNVHPTVKPTDLMRHLVRLVTPTGGTVLDPFLGSGTTALAAEMEGFDWIGIEREAEYIAIAEARLNGVQRGLGLEHVG